MLKINLEYVKGILFVRLHGPLTKKTSSKLNNYLVPVIIQQGIKYMVYNLYELKDIDEIGKKALMYSSLAVNANEGETYICEIPGDLEKEFKDLDINKTINESKAIELLNI